MLYVAVAVNAAYYGTFWNRFGLHFSEIGTYNLRTGILRKADGRRRYEEYAQ